MKITHAEKEEVIDWDKPQLVISNDEDKIVVLTTGKHNEFVFVGLKVGSSDYSSMWSKDVFKPFHGTISND